MGKTIDITPTWAGLLPALLAVLEDGTTAKARQIAKDELLKMAFAADAFKNLAAHGGFATEDELCGNMDKLIEITRNLVKGEFSIVVAFGSQTISAIEEGEEVTDSLGGFITEISFSTQAEKNAYIEALENHDGFTDSYVLEGEEIEKYQKS